MSGARSLCNNKPRVECAWHGTFRVAHPIPPKPLGSPKLQNKMCYISGINVLHLSA